MKSFRYVIQDEMGIHARPASMIVRATKQYQSRITLTKEDQCVDLERLMALIGLAVTKGDEVYVTVEGEDEVEAATALEHLFRQNL